MIYSIASFCPPSMKAIFIVFFASLLLGCGAESVGTAATVAKLQADQAEKAKQTMDQFKVQLDNATKAAERNVRQTEEAAKN